MADVLPANVKLKLYRGDSRTWSVVFEDDGELRDLTGYTFTAQIRATADATDVMAPIAAALSGTPTDGTVTLTLTAANAANLVPGTAHWDLQSVKAGVVHTWLAGSVKVVADVTRA